MEKNNYESRLTFIEGSRFTENKNCYALYNCSCGKTNVKMMFHNVKKGTSKSCGCLKNELNTTRLTTHGLSRLNKNIYKTWTEMKARCYNSKSKAYLNYGGRGIIICNEWFNSFESFYNWAIITWEKGLSIDRIDVNGNYEPSNCRWATAALQNQNTRLTTGWEAVYKIRKEYDEGKDIKELSTKFGMAYDTIYDIVKNNSYIDKGYIPNFRYKKKRTVK